MRETDAATKFHRVLLPHLATVLRVAQVLTKNAADAEDLTQETMLKAYRGIDGFAEGTDAKAWLLTILRRVRIDRVRSAAPSAGTASLDAMDLDPAEPDRPEASDYDAVWENPERVLDGFSDRQVIDALRTLPEDIRMTLLLVDVEGLGHPEAGAILGVPVGTIKSRAHRGGRCCGRPSCPSPATSGSSGSEAGRLTDDEVTR